MEIIEVGEQFYILATSPLADDRTRVLKHGNTFAIFDRYGDIQPVGLGEQGIFHTETRFLSKMVLQVAGERPMLLSSTVREDNILLAVDLSNPDIRDRDTVLLPRGSLHIYRSKFLWEGVCYERLRVRNYSLSAVHTTLTIQFDSDFADIFEVRGQHRKQKGHHLPDRTDGSSLVLSYEGVDKVIRRARIDCIPSARMEALGRMAIDIHLEAREETEYLLSIQCEIQDEAAPKVCTSYEQALIEAGRNARQRSSSGCTVQTVNERFNHWLNRSDSDLQMMLTETDWGVYPYAGVPWFSTVFGRDGIITAMEYLWVDPNVARGVLTYLAANQATATNPARDAEPGKILHEVRGGEMAALNEVPFDKYYGSIDSTPLFLILAAEYFAWTADVALLRTIWPNIELALEWIDRYGDQDGDGFVEYFRKSGTGLQNQGWKDSHDAIFHADGSMAEGPIALCEEQSYVYAAKEGMARVAEALGEQNRARDLRKQADALQERFEKAFWNDEIGTYVIALDGQKQQCRVRTSNAGHCLFGGIASEVHAARTAETLLDVEGFSGWGIRTVSAAERGYNPMAYHNGSVWPHDNAMIARGLARYRHQEMAARVLTGMFDLALFSEMHRLPELICGFGRRAGKGPTRYPVACSPQAWAAGSVFMMLQACMGLRVDAAKGQVCLSHPFLPEAVPEVTIRNLRVRDGLVDLIVERDHESVGLRVPRRLGKVEIVMVT